MSKTPRKPEYKLKALNKLTNAKSTIGTAWLNEDGSISVVIDLCCTLVHDPNIVYTLFPNTKESNQ